MMVELTPDAFHLYEPPRRAEREVQCLGGHRADTVLATYEEMPVVAALPCEIVKRYPDCCRAPEELEIAFGNRAPTAQDAAARRTGNLGGERRLD